MCSMNCLNEHNTAMNTLNFHLKPSFSLPSSTFNSFKSKPKIPRFNVSEITKRKSFSLSRTRIRTIVKSTFTENASSSVEIDMVRNKEGVFAPKAKKVVVLWDLDNKPPRGPPYQAATALRRVAEKFGEVVEISAYANRHAFNHLPQWVIQERRERRSLDILERKGVVTPAPSAYVCSVCGRKCKTNIDLRKHFKQLHERERQKKLNRMNSLKGKKRQRFKERYIEGNHKYNEAARTLIKPKVGYRLGSELKRAGVKVKTVEDKPQAADWALKRQIQHSMSSGIDWIFLVSDDSDFSEMLRRAREADLGTVVVGDVDRALGRHADLWVPWLGVENGEISENDLKPRRREVLEREDKVRATGSLDALVDELVAVRSDFHDLETYTYYEGSESDDYQEVEDGDLLWDSEDEGGEDDDGYL